MHPSEPGRNDPCPCGSGKKYKKCCALKKVAAPRATPFRASVLPSSGAPVPAPAAIPSLAGRKFTKLAQEESFKMSPVDHRPAPGSALPPLPEPFGPKEQPHPKEQPDLDPDAEFQMTQKDYRL
jgi:hypothetical protein